MKTPFVTKAQVDEMIKKYPTPFHLYNEKGIRENARKLYQAFSWNKGFKEFFAVKATPNPTIDRKSTRLNSSHLNESRMPSSA